MSPRVNSGINSGREHADHANALRSITLSATAGSVVLSAVGALLFLELRREAVRVGGNAVIAVDLDYSEFSGQGKSMLFLVASGTAVEVWPRA